MDAEGNIEKGRSSWPRKEHAWLYSDMMVVVTFSSCARILGTAHFYFFFIYLFVVVFFFEVEISSRTLTPLFYARISLQWLSGLR